MTRYFQWKKLLHEECPRAEPEDTSKAITFHKGSNGSYFPHTRVISGLYHAYEEW